MTKLGRPTDYNDEIAKEICRTLATSTDGITKLCNTIDHWPAKKTIYEWTYNNEDFRNRYARAKAFQVEWLVEAALEIAFDGSNDTYIDDKGKNKCDHEWVQRSRLKVDTIKWIASKLAPKLYGDKVVASSEPNDDELKKAKAIANKMFEKQ